MIKRRYFIIVTLLVTFIAAQYATAETHGERIAKFVQLSGVGDALESLPAQMDALSSQRLMTSQSPETDKRTNEILKESYDKDIAKIELLKFVSSKMEDNLLLKLLNWYESPLGQKIVTEEKQSSGVGKQANQLRYLATLQENPPNEDRIALIQEVESCTQLSELTTNVTIEIIRGMFKTINLSIPKEKQVDFSSIDNKIISLRPIIQDGFRKQMILNSYYNFRNFSNDEVKEYIVFYKTEEGQKEIEITGSALSLVLNQWFASATDKLLAYAKVEAEKRKE